MQRQLRVNLWQVLVLALGAGMACGSPTMVGPEPNEPKTDPHAQSAEAHRRDAKLEVQRLTAHQEKYDPDAREVQRRCDPERKSSEPGQPICWYETVNPTAVHLEEIEDHRLHAAHHRRAARRLTAEQERACKGVARPDRAESPFAHQRDILGVAPLEVPVGKSKKKKRLAGATVLFGPVPGLTRDDLQQLMECHIAQNAVAGFDSTKEKTEYCPLTVRGVQATVRDVSEGFAVDVHSADDGEAMVIWERVQKLAKVAK